MDRAARRGLAEPAEIADVVVTLEEDTLPVVAPLDHVQRLTLDEILARRGTARLRVPEPASREGNSTLTPIPAIAIPEG
jgi:hypothetical protein